MAVSGWLVMTRVRWWPEIPYISCWLPWCCRQLQTLDLSPTLRNTSSRPMVVTWCVVSFEYFEHYSRVLCKIVIIFTTLEWYNMANNLYFASKCFILSIFTLAKLLGHEQSTNGLYPPSYSRTLLIHCNL